jgi:hypothetical protein
LSAGYSCVLTKVAKDLGIVGVHLAGGETDGQPGRKKRSRTTRSDEAANRIFRPAVKATVVGYRF